MKFSAVLFFFNQETILFGFVIFKVLDTKLTFWEFGAKGERCGCVSVKENLILSEGFASHPITFGRTKRKTRKADKAIARSALEAMKPHPSLILQVSLFTLSAYWQLAIQMSVSLSPLNLPLKFPVTGTRGNGPFCAIYRKQVKAAISLSESY